MSGADATPGADATHPEDGLADPEVALQREADVLAQRFPEVDPAEIEERASTTSGPASRSCDHWEMVG